MISQDTVHASSLCDHQFNELRASFASDGVVFIRGALDKKGIELASCAFQWSLEHPGPGAHTVLEGKPGAFYQDHANQAAFPVYRALLSQASLPSLICEVIGSTSLWLLYEQIWLKQGTNTLRTPWHQDVPYVPMNGDHLVTVWLNLDPVPKTQSLEFIPGSHRGPLYNPTAFDANDPSASMYAEGVWPSLPDIEQQRDAWPIVSFEIAPGDIVVFHPAILHGGAPTNEGQRRRTISLRFFGDRSYCEVRPESGLHEVDRLTADNRYDDPMVEMARLPTGTLFRHPRFHQVC